MWLLVHAGPLTLGTSFPKLGKLSQDHKRLWVEGGRNDHAVLMSVGHGFQPVMYSVGSFAQIVCVCKAAS